MLLSAFALMLPVPIQKETPACQTTAVTRNGHKGIMVLRHSLDLHAAGNYDIAVAQSHQGRCECSLTAYGFIYRATNIIAFDSVTFV